jgi:endonuclease/exonuclease/phosphatase (EEP) superfamily protein YafD
MPKFLFWNLNGSDVSGLLCRMAREELIDMFILAECGSKSWELIEALNAERSDYQMGWSNCERLLFLTRFNSRWLTALFESSHISIQRLELPARRSLLIAAAHLPSKLHFSEESQVFESVQLARMIEEVEASEGHQRTMLLGDLNMNPFEAGMVGARGGLHATMSRRIAGRDTRTVQNEKYRFFYNPMWNHMGDRTDAGGTFYYESSEAVCYFWNMYDQVLLRPDLLKGFAPEQVRIVTEIGGVPLLEGGRPNRKVASDHLPVLVELQF